MNNELLFRIVFSILFLSALTIAWSHRYRAYRAGGSVSEKQENTFVYLVLRLAGLGIWLGSIVYMLNPGWLAWAALPFPAGVRWSGALLTALSIPFAIWAASAIGNNVTRTVVTRDNHQLITSGPYKYIRHPLYTGGMAGFTGLALLAANGFLLFAVIIVFVMLNVRLPQEEAMLIERFGEDYRSYMKTTGRFLPGL